MKRLHHFRFQHVHKTISSVIISLLLSSPLFAMGISDVELLSKLGEPLKAQLRLTHTEELNDAQILIGQADETMYKKLGVERSTAYYRFRFNLDEQRNLTITTKEPIKEPYMNFVLEFRWPEGKIYKELRFLIDPV